ncbi:MAG: hypothetical protein JXR88_17040 [Clostridia bacterium]|nr:hypothetical protein [Clostridia bacterium]
MSKETKSMIGIIIIISLLAIVLTSILGAHHFNLNSDEANQENNKVIVINYEKDVL